MRAERTLPNLPRRRAATDAVARQTCAPRARALGRPRRGTALLLGSLLGLASCASVPDLEANVEGLVALAAEPRPAPVAVLPALGDDPDGTERPPLLLAPRDTLTVEVWGRPDLGSRGGEVEIEPDGTIALPLVGRVPAAGRTATDLAAHLLDLHADALGLAAEEAPRVDLAEAGLATLDADEARPPYRIGPLDRLSIQVWGREDLGSQLTDERGRAFSVVEVDGAVALPFLGRFEVAGLSTAELAARLEAAYADAAVERPQVLVHVLEHRAAPVSVVGAFAQPGLLHLADDLLTLAELVDAAGGATAEADGERLELVRGGVRHRVDLRDVLAGRDDAARVRLERGDAVVLPTLAEGAPHVAVRVASSATHTVLLEGAFAGPGVFPLTQEARTLGEVITAAGGLSANADTSAGVLARGSARYAVDYRGIQLGNEEGLDAVLQPGDRLYFPSIEERRVYVTGEVLRPGAVLVPPEGLSLHDALMARGGPDRVSADVEELYLVRPDPEAQTAPLVCVFTFAELMAMPETPVFPGDTVYTPPTWLAQWDRFWTQLLPFARDTSQVARNVDLAVN